MAIAAGDLAEALGPAPSRRFVGVEHEYAVRAGPHQLDFRAIIDRLPIEGARVDPRDWYAHRCPWGGVITCDGREAEIACPPVALADGFDDEIVAVGVRGETALRAALPDHLDLVPYSTHISVSAADPWRVAARMAQTAAVAMVGDACGVIVRARPGRVELCFEPLHGDALRRMVRFVTGAVLALDGDLDALGPPLGVRTEPGVERPGWYVDRERSLASLAPPPDYERWCALPPLAPATGSNPWSAVVRPGLLSVTWDVAVFDIGDGVAAVPSPWLGRYLALLDAGELDDVLRRAPRRGRLRSWAQTSTPGTFGGLGNTIGLVTPELTGPTVSIATGTGKERPPGQADPPITGWHPPWWWIAIAIFVLIGIIGFFLSSGGDDDPPPATTTTTSTTVATTTASAAPTTETTVRTSTPPTNLAFASTFEPPTYTTHYVVSATDPDNDALTYEWTFQPAEVTCGVFVADGPRASWQHPHESQRDQVPDFPPDRYCAETATGHAGTISVTVSDGVNRCAVVWEQGAQEGALENLACSG